VLVLCICGICEQVLLDMDLRMWMFS
jgi:hypothetical protein